MPSASIAIFEPAGKSGHEGMCDLASLEMAVSNKKQIANVYLKIAKIVASPPKRSSRE
jgi:hypothetical protein